jgi:hypothetical protein
MQVITALLVLLSLVESEAFSCYTEGLCEINWREDNFCESECANELCDFDQDSVLASSPAYNRMIASDCIYECLKVCTKDQLANEQCDPNCEVQVCGYDAGACGFCALGCEL